MKPGLYVGGLCLLAAIAGLAAFRFWHDNVELSAQVTRLSRQNADLRYEAKRASEQAKDIGQRAVELDSQLGSAKIRSTATETKNQQLTRELTEREQREVALMAELAELRQKATAGPREEPEVLPALNVVVASPPRAAPQPAVASVPMRPATPVAPAVDVEAYRRRIAELEQQLITLLARSLAEMPPEPAPAASVQPAVHQVVRVGPANSFVVIDYGAEHGARPAALLRLRRGTSDVARVQIADVRPRFSLAEVLPGTLKGQLQSGDLVVFTQ